MSCYQKDEAACGLTAYLHLHMGTSQDIYQPDSTFPTNCRAHYGGATKPPDVSARYKYLDMPIDICAGERQ